MHHQDTEEIFDSSDSEITTNHENLVDNEENK